MARILVADSDPNCRSAVREILEPLNHQVWEAEDGKKAVSTSCSRPLDLIILDVNLPKFYGPRGIKTLREECPELTILVMADCNLISTVIATMKLGVFDYILKPLNQDELRVKIERVQEHCRLVSQNKYLHCELGNRHGIEHPIGISPAVKEAHLLAEQYARTDKAVLINGEKGTGKEHIARAIHRKSKRADGPFVKFNCLAKPGSSIDVELFGMDALASGTSIDRAGCIDTAMGGAIYLNEISNFGPEIQDMLLYLLLRKQFLRTNGEKVIPSDVRLIASSSVDLAEATEQGSFRPDLYKALSKSVINLPPLRDRQEDIPALADFFVKKHSAEAGKPISSISDAAIEQILDCEWHGNISELENCIERSVIVCDGSCIQPVHLALNGGRSSAKRKQGHIKSLREVERDHIKRVLIYCNWNRSTAANILEIDRKTLRSKIREFGFTPPPEK